MVKLMSTDAKTIN
jgi:hypothetical protein